MLSWLRTWRESLNKTTKGVFSSSTSSPSRPTHSRVGPPNIGSVVIAVPDANGAMIVGPIKSFDGRYGIIPVIDDFISGKSIMCASPLTVYSNTTFHLLVGLTPKERYARVTPPRFMVGAKRRLTKDLSQAEYLAKVNIGLAKHMASLGVPADNKTDTKDKTTV